MSENKNELPVLIKNKNLFNLKKNNFYKIYDILVRVGKTLGGFAVGIGGATLSAAGSFFGAPIIIPVGYLISVYGIYRGAENALNQYEPGLMFVTKSFFSSESKINQKSKLFFNHMNGYNNMEKVAMMTLQTLVGLSRFKESLEGSDYEEKNDGSKIYKKVFSTVTHDLNLRMFESLNNLGIIEIEENPKVKKESFLIMEKIGFGNFEDLKDMFRLWKKKDKKLSGYKKKMKEIKFKLTDKPIDFEEIYKKINGDIPYESDEEKKSLRMMRRVFRRKDKDEKNGGILVTKGLDIDKDKTGRTILVYNSKGENFGKRVDKKIENEKKNNKFENRMQEGITLEMKNIINKKDSLKTNLKDVNNNEIKMSNEKNDDEHNFS